MLACMNTRQVSTLLNIGSKLVNLLITIFYTGSQLNFKNGSSTVVDIDISGYNLHSLCN